MRQINDFIYNRLESSELLENLIRPNGVNTTWSYEANRNLVTQVQNGTISVFGYTNDALGRRTAMSRGGSAFTQPDILSYTYNDRSEVISASSNVDTTYNYNYAFDPIGNRLTLDDKTYTTNALNQYTAINTETLVYDDDGNMQTNNGWAYTWNGENRLIKAEKGTAKLEFDYDYMGRRIFKKVFDDGILTKHTRFVYSNYKLIEELDALNGNAVIRRYTWQPESVGLDVPLQVNDIATNQTYYYLTDANKNITDLVDGNGVTVAHYEYSPFGQLTASSGSYADTNPFRFSSEYYDPETKLVYYNYRYYNPGLGRWLSKDPIEENGGMNLYRMIANNTIGRYDINGLLDSSEFMNPKGLPGHSDTDWEWGHTFLPNERAASAVHWYKNWGGGGWANGRWVRDGWMNPLSPNYVPGPYVKPADELDKCYRDHDRCYEDCRMDNTCPLKEGRCKSSCDYVATACQLKATFGRNYWNGYIQAPLGMVGLGAQGLARDAWLGISTAAGATWSGVTTAADATWHGVSTAGQATWSFITGLF